MSWLSSRKMFPSPPAPPVFFRQTHFEFFATSVITCNVCILVAFLASAIGPYFKLSFFSIISFWEPSSTLNKARKRISAPISFHINLVSHLFLFPNVHASRHLQLRFGFFYVFFVFSYFVTFVIKFVSINRVLELALYLQIAFFVRASQFFKLVDSPDMFFSRVLWITLRRSCHSLTFPFIWYIAEVPLHFSQNT